MEQKTIIAVFCYKRAAKLKRSMEALLQNPECADMDVVFFCDGPKGDHDREGVMQTREYIDSVSGFKNIYKHYRESNLSTGPNFKQGITWLCDNYDRFVVVEDDLVVAPNYISFVLQGLDFYKEDKAVFCVTGFCFPINVKDYRYDSIIHRRFCSYGWGSWSDRVQHVKWDKEDLQDMMKTPKFFTKLNKEGHDLSRMVTKQIDGVISTWDIQMQVHVSNNDMKVVYPVISKTQNIGFDAESTNTFGVDYLKTTVDSGSQRTFHFCLSTTEVPSLQGLLRKPYNLPALVSRKMANTYIKYSKRLRAVASAFFNL